jgi:molecular chaperone DnaK (HSP70)
MCSVRLLKKLWGWPKKRHTTDELKQTFFLAKDLMGRTAWYNAAETNSTKVLDVLWEWGKEELTTEELSNKLLLVKDDKEKKRLARDRNNGQHRVMTANM